MGRIGARMIGANRCGRGRGIMGMRFRRVGFVMMAYTSVVLVVRDAWSLGIRWLCIIIIGIFDAIVTVNCVTSFVEVLVGLTYGRGD
jgi:hypothetical protein